MSDATEIRDRFLKVSTATLTTSTRGVTALTTIRALEQIWVRY